MGGLKFWLPISQQWIQRGNTINPMIHQKEQLFKLLMPERISSMCPHKMKMPWTLTSTMSLKQIDLGCEDWLLFLLFIVALQYSLCLSKDKSAEKGTQQMSCLPTFLKGYWNLSVEDKPSGCPYSTVVAASEIFAKMLWVPSLGSKGRSMAWLPLEKTCLCWSPRSHLWAPALVLIKIICLNFTFLGP